MAAWLPDTIPEQPAVVLLSRSRKCHGTSALDCPPPGVEPKLLYAASSTWGSIGVVSWYKLNTTIIVSWIEAGKVYTN